MSDLYLQILKTQLDRFHEMLELEDAESDAYWFALTNIDKCMNVLTMQPAQGDIVEDTINKLLKDAPTGEAQ